MSRKSLTPSEVKDAIDAAAAALGVTPVEVLRMVLDLMEERDKERARARSSRERGTR